MYGPYQYFEHRYFHVEDFFLHYDLFAEFIDDVEYNFVLSISF